MKSCPPSVQAGRARFLYAERFDGYAKEDVQAFKAFVDFSNTFFKNNDESELQKILNNVNLDD